MAGATHNRRKALMPAEYSAIMLQKHFEAINDRLRGIENQVKLLSYKAGLPY